MKREEIIELRNKMSDWHSIAQERVKTLDENQVNYLDLKIISLKRKNSKDLANSLCEDISELLGMTNPLNLCVDWKWEGFFGLRFVLGLTIYKLSKTN